MVVIGTLDYNKECIFDWYWLLESVHEKTRQNWAGYDAAQITDFAQTWDKYWVLWGNDYGRKADQYIYALEAMGGPAQKWPCDTN